MAEGKDIDQLIKQVKSNVRNAKLVKGSDLSLELMPTGIPGIDLSVGGIGRGRITIITGETQSFKSSLALKIASYIQDEFGMLTAFIDSENSYDSRWADQLGVNTDNMIVTRPSSMEEAYDIVKYLVGADNMGCVIIDSIASLASVDELEKAATDSGSVANRARITNKFVRIVNQVLVGNNTSMLFIQNVYHDISSYGPSIPTAMPGGRQQKYLSSLTINLRRKGWIPKSADGLNATGMDVRWMIDKCKYAPGHGKGETRIWLRNFIDENGIEHEIGEIDVAFELYHYMRQFDMIERRGAYYDVFDNTLQGKGELFEFIEDNQSSISEKLMEEAEKRRSSLIMEEGDEDE